MPRWDRGDPLDPLEQALCPVSNSLPTHHEEEEDDVSLVSNGSDLREADDEKRVSFDPSRVHSPLQTQCETPSRLMSPLSLSSDSTWSPEPSSPVSHLYGDDYDDDRGSFPMVSSLLDEEEPHTPPQSLFFSPWMCVYDLDSACGANLNSVDDDTAKDHQLPQKHTADRDRDQSSNSEILDLPAFPNLSDWNHLLPSMDVSNWFGKNLPVVEECENSTDDDDRIKRIRPRPTYPSSLSGHNFFTDFASEHEIEAIYVPAEEAAAPAPAAAAPTDKGMPRRRAPVAQASMSLTPAAAAALNKNIQTKQQQQHSGPSSGQRNEALMAVVTSADAQEIVQVKTPGADRSALKDLPALRDAPPTKREELFIMKLKLCSVIFSFDDPTSDKRGKDMKRQTLLELVDYVNTPAGQKIFTECIMGDLMAMVSANVCRALPPATDDFDPEEDEPVLEPAWPHLQVAYEFFLRFIVSSEVNAKAAKKYVDQKFCLQLVELFDSEDPRERDYLKTILHRIYGKFMSHRSFIRRAISNVFYRFVYETERHNGIGELLEILGSIINGFAIPLKKEHLQFLVRALIPLHKPKCVALYHQQLSYCIIQYVEKDADTATPILNGFFKCWPWSCSGKQVMFLNELEEILELLGADQLAQVSTMLFTNLARCLDSDHFQVVERALFLWNNEHLVNSGCLSRLNAHTVLPIIYGPLYKNSSGHWNATVEGLAQNVLKMYMEYDLALYDKCTAAYFREEEEAKKRLEALADKWHAIEQAAMAQAPEIMAK